MDPITLIAGAVIALVSLGIGHITGRLRRKRVGPPPTICEGCKHGLSYHDDHGKCHGTDRRTNYSTSGGEIGTHDVPCTCQQYVGEIPAERMLANFSTRTLPPAAEPQVQDR